jgi:hypothetical protein
MLYQLSYARTLIFTYTSPPTGASRTEAESRHAEHGEN